LEARVRRVVFADVALPTFLAAALVAAPSLYAQSASQSGSPSSSAAVSPALIDSLARLDVAISHVRDSAQFAFSRAANKKIELQTELHQKYAAEIARVFKEAGMSEDEYHKKIFLVSTNAEANQAYEQAVSKLTGVPTAGQVVAKTSTPAVKVPAGPVGVHIGHIMNSFKDTPDNQGLLAVALSEAKTANTHATLAARNPGNLDALKLHAGHILNALDPSIVPMGPGLGYGLKKAALGISQHIELAAKTPGASPNVAMHSTHVSAAAKATADRADKAIELAKKVQASSNAAEAADLMNQLISITAQLTTGDDVNGDGKVDWKEPEGGLQQVEQHMQLMLAGEGIKPE
jgi:hypothetical protein